MKYQMPDIPGWIYITELDWLYQTAQGMDSVVEIGSWMGKSTHALLSGCRGTVHVVDHFHGSPSEPEGTFKIAAEVDVYAEFMKYVGHFPNLTVHRMSSLEAAGLFTDKSVDMVFIDGEHTFEAVRDDLTAWLPKCRRLICGHDITHDGVVKALTFLKIPWQREMDTIWGCRL